MRNIKTLLRLMGAAALTTVAASSVVACGTQKNAPQLDEKYAVLLDWTDGTTKASKIAQKLNINSTAGQELAAIAAVDTNIVKPNLFKNNLLIEGSASGKFKANGADAAKFLADLNFKSGSTTADYSKEDVDAITALVAKVTRSDAGKIEENGTTDFKVAAGTCQVSIMDKTGDGAKVVKSYTVNTFANDTLNVVDVIFGADKIIVNKDSLELTADQGFKQGQPVTGFKFKVKDLSKEKQFNSLVTLLKTKVTTKFFDAASAGAEVTGNFGTDQVFLQIYFGQVTLSSRVDCGTPLV